MARQIEYLFASKERFASVVQRCAVLIGGHHGKAPLGWPFQGANICIIGHRK